MTIPTRELVYLAGLLHDIGKFGLRADRGNFQNSTLLSTATKNLIADYCPKNTQGIATHLHVLWTAQFLEDLGIHHWTDSSGSNLRDVACKHHLASQTGLEWIIQKADHLSSGVDRLQGSGKKEGDQETKDSTSLSQNLNNDGLHSIFEHLGRDESKELSKPIHSIPLSEWQIIDDLLPKENVNSNIEYSGHWKKFIEEVYPISQQQPRYFSENIDYILERYTSTIPSSTIHLPDVSLYDHNRITAGLALCLYDFFFATSPNAINTLNANETSQLEFLFIGSDLSGIQDFIYSIPSKGAAKQLKARSFYLQALMDGILFRLLEELQLHRGNVIYNSGGGFHIIAANTEENKLKLSKFRDEIEETIIEEYRTDLYVALDWIAVSSDDLMIHDNTESSSLSLKWQELSAALGQLKGSRYGKLSRQNYTWFFEPNTSDAIQTKENTFEQTTRSYPFDSLDGEDEAQIGTGTGKDFAELGKNLKKCKAIVFSNDRLEGCLSMQLLKNVLGRDLYLSIVVDVNRKFKNTEGSLILKINDTDKIPFAVQRISSEHNIVEGFMWLGGNAFPDGTFEDLCEGGTGIKRLGVLRMDVDGLGWVFSQGLGKKRYTLSRVAALSRSLDWFFKGYINEIIARPGKHIQERICSDTTQYHNHINLIYSGGDDLFLIGRWDAVLDLAQAIRYAFKKFSCDNPSLGLSGGLVLVPPKYPIAQAARHADEAESRSKSHSTTIKNRTIEKDAITIFGTPLQWQWELETVLDLFKDFEEKIGSKDLNNAILGHLVQWYSIYSTKQNLSWKWLSAYQLGRMRNDKNPKLNEWLMKLQKAIYTNDTNWKGDHPLPKERSFIELAAIASRLTEIGTRKQD